MLSYTKATLKDALLLWNRNSDPEFEAELDHIIQRGEVQLTRALDLAKDLSTSDTTTADLSAEVFKPSGLIRETDLFITVDSVRTPLLKRSPAWVKMCSQTPGTPLYYAELDDGRWQVGPPALDEYLIEVAGEYPLESITDGNDDNTTWASTAVPDLLYLACAIHAAHFLKFWALKTQMEADFGVQVAIFRGDAANMQKTDAEDQLGDRQQANPVKPPGA